MRIARYVTDSLQEEIRLTLLVIQRRVINNKWHTLQK